MDPYWWGMHMLGWMVIVPLAFALVCVLILFTYVFRGPRWFHSRRDRHELDEAVHEILARRYASGEITREEYEEMKRVLVK